MVRIPYHILLNTEHYNNSTSALFWVLQEDAVKEDVAVIPPVKVTIRPVVLYLMWSSSGYLVYLLVDLFTLFTPQVL